MDPDKGYRETKRPLKKHFGNEYMISVAYRSKALNCFWHSEKKGSSTKV